MDPKRTSVKPSGRRRARLVTPDWQDLVARVRRGEPGGMEQLYSLFSRGIRFHLYRQLGPQELEDKVHDTFLIVVQTIQRGELRNPERLMGFVRTVVRRQIATHIDSTVQVRRDQTELEPGLEVCDERYDLEADAIEHQREELVARVLHSVSTRDREILTRFYLQGQTQDQICREMQLSVSQFRLLKSRAKARFGEVGRKRLRLAKSPAMYLPLAVGMRTEIYARRRAN